MPARARAIVRRSRRRRDDDPESSPLVLIVDDFQDNRELYAMQLQASGYRVEQAANGREALEKIRLAEPAVVLMDLSMPVLDGWEATRLLKADPKTAHIAVIALTSNATRRGLREVAAAGADAIVTRPCLPSDLVMRVGAMLGPSYPGAASNCVRLAALRSLSRRHVVLLVDEDDDSRHLFMFVLVRYGFDVVATTNAAEAAVALGLHRVDAVIVQERYSEGAAAGVLGKLGKRQRPRVRMVVSGFDSPMGLCRNRRAGFHVHAALPCTPFDLEPVLRECLLLAEDGRLGDNAFSVVRGGHVEDALAR